MKELNLIIIHHWLFCEFMCKVSPVGLGNLIFPPFSLVHRDGLDLLEMLGPVET